MIIICIAKNFIWTTLKIIFSIFTCFCTLRIQILKYLHLSQISSDHNNTIHQWTLIYSAFRLCINLNFEKMTLKVLCCSVTSFWRYFNEELIFKMFLFRLILPARVTSLVRGSPRTECTISYRKKNLQRSEIFFNQSLAWCFICRFLVIKVCLESQSLTHCPQPPAQQCVLSSRAPSWLHPPLLAPAARSSSSTLCSLSARWTRPSGLQLKPQTQALWGVHTRRFPSYSIITRHFTF